MKIFSKLNKAWIGLIFGTVPTFVLFWAISVPLYTHFMPEPEIRQSVIHIGGNDHDWTKWEEIKRGDVKLEDNVVGTFVDLQRVCKLTGEIQLKKEQTDVPIFHDWGKWEETGTGNVTKGKVVIGKWSEQKRVCKLTGEIDLKNERTIDVVVNSGDRQWGEWEVIEKGRYSVGDSSVGYYCHLKRTCALTNQIELDTIKTRL